MDFSELIKAVRGNREALAEMIDEFLPSCPNRVRDIQSAVENRDGSGLEKKAHGFKSAVGIWGSSQAFEVLSRLEEAALENDFLQAEKLVADLPGELEKLSLALSDLRDSL